MTRVVNIKHEEFDVYIGRGRGSKWGNPFTHVKDKDTLAEHIVESREEAIAKYHDYILNNPELLNALSELEDKVLGCWCKPDTCHGDILVALISQNKLKSFLKN